MASKSAILLAAAVLSGCAGHTPTDLPDRGVASVNVPVLTRADFVFDAAAPDGSLAPDEFKPRVGQLRERLRREEATHESQTRASTAASEISDIQSALDRFSKEVVTHLETADPTKQRELIKLLIKRIEITAEEVRIVYKVPIHPFVQGPASGAFLQHRLQFPVKPPAYESQDMIPKGSKPLAGGRAAHHRVATTGAPIPKGWQPYPWSQSSLGLLRSANIAALPIAKQGSLGSRWTAISPARLCRGVAERHHASSSAVSRFCDALEDCC